MLKFYKIFCKFLQDDTSSLHRLNSRDYGASNGGRGGRRKPSFLSSFLGPYAVNGRLLLIIIALTCFLLSLALFIGTVVVVHNSHSSSTTNCLQEGSPTASTSSPPTTPTHTKHDTKIRKGKDFCRSLCVLNGFYMNYTLCIFDVKWA